MTRENILKLQEHQNYCGRPFNRLNIEFMPFSNKYSAQFYGCDYLHMFSIYAGSYDNLMSDIAELINEVTNK
jgi:hypothetical protein